MTTRRIVVATVAVFVIAAAAQAQNAAIGTWDLTTVSPVSETKSVLEIRQEGDKLVAVGKSAQGERKYDSAVVDGSTVTLVITVAYEGSPMVITYTGKIDGAKIEGQTDYGGLATGTFSAARK